VALIWLPVALATCVVMELWAALVHRLAWHGPLWSWHQPHHGRERGWSTNDVLSASHAPVAIALILYGCTAEGVIAQLTFGVGIGMTVFGVAYVVVHDGFVHRRLPLAFLGSLPYFAHLRRAHHQHHATGGPPFGLFAARRTVRRSRGSRGAS
jgi:beta-carotene 3-hydroxylase